MIEWKNIKSGTTGKAKSIDHYRKLQRLSGGDLSIISKDSISKESKEAIASTVKPKEAAKK